jgi:hypothetical protein
VAKEEVDIMLSFIRDAGIDLGNLRALDFFAKDGYNLTRHYAPYVKHVTSWEIDESHKEVLVSNLPLNSSVVIGDSYELCKQSKDRFDVIVFDNPLACYGEGDKYCEHFDCIELINTMLNQDGIVTFNVKLKPYSYESNFKWQSRRNHFYNVKDASNLELRFVEGHYSDLFKNMGYSVKCMRSIERKQEKDLYMIVAILEGNQQ